MEPSCLLLEEPALSLQSTEGFVLWAALKAQWALRCETHFQATPSSLDDFVAQWMGVLEVWRAEKNLSLSRADLQHLLDQLNLWFSWGMFQQRVPAPSAGTRGFPEKSVAPTASAKERKCGQFRDGVVQRLAVLSQENWTLVYTNGSAKQLPGWWQAGCGAGFGDADERSTGLPAPVAERQSASRGELQGVLYALERRRADEKMVIVLDSEYVYKGITQWSPRWHRHGWRVKSQEVGHRDLWEAIFCLRQAAGALLKFV